MQARKKGVKGRQKKMDYKAGEISHKLRKTRKDL
jgi:hypothetical protein